MIRDISRELGQLLENAFIAGLPTPMLCMENTHRALYVWENFTNYQNTFEKYPITHLFLAEFNDEIGYYKRKFPDVMQRAQWLKTYWIKGSQFYLFSVIDPSIENVHVSQEQDDSGESVHVSFEIANNDPRAAKTFEPGILLLPKDPALPSFSAQEELRIEPLARTQVSLSKHVPPAEYKVLATLFSEHHDSYEVETLGTQGGKTALDPGASGGKARYASPNFSGFLSYGPYRRYPAGKYEVEFVLKYHEVTSDNDRPLATLDVSTNTGRTILAKRTVKVTDFTEPKTYQTFRLSFLLEKPEVLEFRVSTHGQIELWADVVHVSYLPGVWYASSIVIRE